MNEDEKIGTVDFSDENIVIKDEDSQDDNSSSVNARKDSLDNIQPASDGNVGNKFIAYFVIGIVIVLFVIYLVQFIYTPTLREGVTGAVSAGLDYPHDESLKNDEYNGFQFRHEDLWKVEIPGTSDGKKVIFDVEFYYTPWEMKNVKIVGNFGPSFANKTVISSFNSRQENLSLMAVANGQIVKMLQKTFGKNVIGACGFNETVDGEEISGCESRPIVDCSTPGYPVFYLQYGPEEKVEFKDNCVLIQGSGWGLVKAAEAAMMKGYSILK